MLDKFEQQIISDFPDIKEYELYLAISGGKDSIVLSHLLKSAKLNHTLLHCNFQLRGKESDEDEAFLIEYATKQELPIEIQKFDTYQLAKENGTGIQETARNLRYNWFESFVNKKNVLVLTAHHLDDSIETFFINLMRGTGHKGVRGIPKFNPPYYRPMLSFTADEVYKYIDQNNIDYREDSSNADTKYLRNRLRHSIIPLLLEIEPGLKPKMSAFFNEMIDLDAFLEEQISELKKGLLRSSDHQYEADLDKIKALDRISIQFGLRDFGIRRTNIQEFMKFLQSSVGAHFYSNSHTFLIDRERLLIQKSESINDQVNLTVETIPANISIPNGSIEFKIEATDQFQKQNNPLQLDYNKVVLPLTLRTWEKGDKIIPLGMSGSKLISDILIDKKIPQFKKNRTLVIEDSNNAIIAIPGLIISEKVRINGDTIKLLNIFLTQN